MLQREHLDVVEVVRECVEDPHASLDERAIRLDLRLPDTPIWVEGDRTRLCQVVSNLLSNAAKFSDHGALIAVGLHADPRHAVLEVLDEGAASRRRCWRSPWPPYRRGASS